MHTHTDDCFLTALLVAGAVFLRLALMLPRMKSHLTMRLWGDVFDSWLIGTLHVIHFDIQHVFYTSSSDRDLCFGFSSRFSFDLCWFHVHASCICTCLVYPIHKPTRNQLHRRLALVNETGLSAWRDLLGQDHMTVLALSRSLWLRIIVSNKHYSFECFWMYRKIVVLCWFELSFFFLILQLLIHMTSIGLLCVWKIL